MGYSNNKKRYVKGNIESLIKEIGLSGVVKKYGVNRSTIWRWRHSKTSPNIYNIEKIKKSFDDADSVFYLRAKYVIKDLESGIIVNRGFISTKYHKVSDYKRTYEQLRESINILKRKIEVYNKELRIINIKEIYKHIDEVAGLVQKEDLHTWAKKIK